MKFILVLIIPFLFFESFEEVKKRNKSYTWIITESDLIVDGRIEKVNDANYFFMIQDFIKGAGEEQIKVKFWREWTCDKRVGWNPEPGQRILLFLKQQEDGSYLPINGSSGELYVNDNNTVKKNIHHEYPNVYDIRFGVKKFIETFEIVSVGEYYGSTSYQFKRTTSIKEIHRIMEQSSFFTMMAEEILDSER